MKFKKPIKNSLLSVVFLSAIALISSCGDDKEENVGGRDSGAKELKTAGAKFLVKPSVESYRVGDFTVRYNIVTADGNRTPLPSGEYEYVVTYGMPTMPKMKIRAPKVTKVGPGVVEVVYHFQHGGSWRSNIAISKGGTVADVLSYDFEVK